MGLQSGIVRVFVFLLSCAVINGRSLHLKVSEMQRLKQRLSYNLWSF